MREVTGEVVWVSGSGYQFRTSEGVLYWDDQGEGAWAGWVRAEDGTRLPAWQQEQVSYLYDCLTYEPSCVS